MLDEVVRLGHRVTFERRLRQIVQAFEAAALEQFSQAAFQRHFQARVRAERGEHAAGTRVHQGHAHHRELAAQRGILDQHREALGFQPLDPGQDTRVLGQHVSRHIRQGEFTFDDFTLDRPLEDLRQALHLGFGQGVAGAHAVAQVQVFDQVGREIHHLAVRLAHKRQRPRSRGLHCPSWCRTGASHATRRRGCRCSGSRRRGFPLAVHPCGPGWNQRSSG